MVIDDRFISFSIIILISVSALNPLSNILGLGSVVKLVQAMVMLLFILCIYHHGFNKSRFTLLPILSLIFLIVNAALFLWDDGRKLVILSFLQISFFYICLVFFRVTIVYNLS